MAKISLDSAKRILSAQKIISNPGIYSNIKVTNISFTNKNGIPWTWEDSDEAYAIVNFQAANEYGIKQAIEDMKAGRYDEAVNRNLSLRVDPETAKAIQSVGMANVEFDTRILKDESVALLPIKARPAEMQKAEALSMDALMEELGETVTSEKSEATSEEPAVTI